MLMAAMIFLGYQLFFGNRQPSGAEKQKTEPELMQELRLLNQNLADVSIVRAKQAYERKLSELRKANQLTEAEVDAKKREATVLVADTQYKAGLKAIDRKNGQGVRRLNQAYLSVESLRKRYERKPEAWAEQYGDLPITYTAGPTGSQIPDPLFEHHAWTSESLYNAVVSELQVQYRTDKVLGILPGYALIDVLVRFTGSQPAFSYWFAALLLAIIVRIIVWPLAQKQLMFGRQMAQLGPLATEIRERYKDKPQELQVKTMELYREYGINPVAGCLPALVQMPLFLLIYQCMLHYRFEFQKGTFLWINPTTSAASNGIIAKDLGHIDLPLIVLYAASMVVTTLLTPVNDPAQKRQQRMIGLMLALIFPAIMFFGVFPIPAAFVLYWTFTNVLATIQSLRAYRLPLPPLVKVNASGGGVFPTQPANGQASTVLNGQKKTGKPATHKPKKRH